MVTKKQKGQKGQVHSFSHHPSQSSVNVPQKIKNEVKELQNFTCWLCGLKNHKNRRPLQICHIYPQAAGKNYQVSVLSNRCFIVLEFIRTY